MDQPHRFCKCLCRPALLLILAALSVVAASCREPELSIQKTILVDNLHSRKRTQDIGMPWDAYDYSHLHGMKRLFDFLAQQGYPHRFITAADTPRLTAEILAGVRILFVDLLGSPENCVDFDADEIEVIRQWVDRGGSLFVVVDHTNVYEHAHRTNPLLEPFGVQAYLASAIDKVPENAMQGGVWIKVRSVAEHPVTRGVESLLFMTGTALDTKQGVVFLSPDGFADAWWPESPHPALLGNCRYDEGEPRGALPLVAAGNHGQGRFVVIGDENLLGNSRLFMANNFELIANAFEWLAHDEQATVPLRQRLRSQLRVGFDLLYSDWNIAGNGCNCYLNFYTDFNKVPGTMARGLPSLEGKWDVLVLTDPMLEVPDKERGYLRRHLENGGTLVLLTDVARARAGTPGLLGALLPRLEMVGRRTFTPRDLPAGPDLVAAVSGEQEFLLSSRFLDVQDLRMAAHEYPRGRRCGFEVGASRPYLLQMTATGGEPFLQAQVGDQTVDLARIYKVGRGQLIVFFQDSFFRNETMGIEMRVPGPRTADSHQVIRVLVQWLLDAHRNGEEA